MHSDIWKPTFDIILASKISREDGVVFISSVFPSELIKEERMLLLTNDNQFENATNENNFQRKINSYFRLNNIKRPEIIHIEKFTCQGTTVNLTKKEDDLRSLKLIFDKVQSHQIESNIKFYIGKTINVPANAPPNVICFELPENTILYENTHLVIIGKNLDFYYTTKSPIRDYRNQMNQLVYPFSSQTITRLAFLLIETNQDGAILQHPLPMMGKLRESGNLIFIHPDTLLP